MDEDTIKWLTENCGVGFISELDYKHELPSNWLMLDGATQKKSDWAELIKIMPHLSISDTNFVLPLGYLWLTFDMSEKLRHKYGDRLDCFYSEDEIASVCEEGELPYARLFIIGRSVSDE